jgi:DNA-binding XRE family transcriptional regulator
LITDPIFHGRSLWGSFVEYIPWIVNPVAAILWLMETRLERVKGALADNIRRQRARLGLSQEALALSAEVDRTYVSQIERGIGNPSLLILCKLCDVLEVELVDILQMPNAEAPPAA